MLHALNFQVGWVARGSRKGFGVETAELLIYSSSRLLHVPFQGSSNATALLAPSRCSGGPQNFAESIQLQQRVFLVCHQARVDQRALDLRQRF